MFSKQPKPEARRAIEAQINHFEADRGGPDETAKILAVAAAEEGRAAYWSTATYHSAKWCLFRNACNNLSLDDGLHDFTDDRNPLLTAEALIATLIPLNTKAIYELRDARDKARWAAAANRQVAA